MERPNARERSRVGETHHAPQSFAVDGLSSRVQPGWVGGVVTQPTLRGSLSHQGRGIEECRSTQMAAWLRRCPVLLFVVELAPEIFELSLQLSLSQGDGEVTAGALEDAPYHVGGPSQTPGEGIVEVDCYQEAVDVVHRLEYLFAAVDMSIPQGIEQMPSELSRRLSKSIEVSGVADAEFIGVRQGFTRNQCQGDAGLGILLLGVVNEATVEKRGVLGKRAAHIFYACP